MALAEALRELRRHWDEALRRMPEPERAQMLAWARECADLDYDDGVDAALELIPRVARTLPPEHPISQALDEDAVRLGTGDGALRLQTELSAFAVFITGVEIKAALLAAPGFSPEEVCRRGHDPAAEGLIRMAGADGAARLPGFQFDEEGAPRPVVIRINRLLRADTDPWGVTSWWLEPNAWLGEAPARLLGRARDEELVAVAEAVGEGGA